MLLLSILLAASALAQTFPGTAADQPAAVAWWDDYPLITESSDLNTVLSHNSTVAFDGSADDPSWGLYFQRAGENARQDMAKFHRVGIKCISFYKAFGPITSFAIELGNRGNLDYTPIYRTHWSWTLPDKGGPISWTGPQTYFDAPAFTGVYNRLHPRYGGPAMTYPDGAVATGTLNKFPGINGDPTTDPRNSAVWDAGLSKSLYGDFCGDISFNDDVNAINPATGLPMGPLRGLIQMPDGRYSSYMSMHKDDCCPFWADFQYGSVLYGADQGLDGIWADNYGPIDGFGIHPVTTGFGDWSVARFRDYLNNHFTAAQLTALGVTVAMNTFDVRSVLRTKLTALGGNAADVNDSHWNAASWLDDPLWRAYKIFKRQTGTEALTNYYNATKAAATLAGKADFLVQGNDIPFFCLGWVRGNLDQVSTEMTAGWHFGSSSRGIMLPPVGRFSPIHKLAREHAKSRFVNIWMYVDAPYQGKPGIAQVLDYEMLANHALPMHHPDNPAVAGTATSNAAFFKFVKDHKAVFGLRMPVADIGVYYSTSSVLDFMTPADILNMDQQPHQHAYYGWGTALGELHYQYRVIPEWKLTGDALHRLRVLIVPNAEVLDPSDVTNVIGPWVQAGGLLVVTGNSGYRLGEAGNFDPNPAGLSLAGLTGVSSYNLAPATKLSTVGAGKVYYIRDNIGMTYFNTSTAALRGPYLAAHFKPALDAVLTSQPPVVLTTANAPGTLGLNVYEDARAASVYRRQQFEYRPGQRYGANDPRGGVPGAVARLAQGGPARADPRARAVARRRPHGQPEFGFRRPRGDQYELLPILRQRGARGPQPGGGLEALSMRRNQAPLTK